MHRKYGIVRTGRSNRYNTRLWLLRLTILRRDGDDPGLELFFCQPLVGVICMRARRTIVSLLIEYYHVSVSSILAPR